MASKKLVKRDILSLVPRVDVHPKYAVVDGVTYPGGLAEYYRKIRAESELEQGQR